MAKESSIIGVMLGQASEVQNIKIVSQIIWWLIEVMGSLLNYRPKL